MSRALVALVLAGGCTCRRAPSEVSRARELRDEICACSTTACVDEVGRRFQAKYGKREDRSSQEPEIVKAISVCLERISRAEQAAAISDAGVRDAALDAPPAQPAVPVERTADALLAAARAWQQTTHPELVTDDIDVRYVGADGVIDPEFGAVVVVLSAPKSPVDDPARRTGAPVKPAARPPSCPTLRFAQGTWYRTNHSCELTRGHTPRCSVPVIWQRAIAQGAPADALAVLEFRAWAQPTWVFRISDELRGVAITHQFHDDCPLAVEQSP